MILDEFVDPSSIQIENLIIRMDYFFNQQALEILLKTKKCIIFTNKPIDINILKSYKNNILQVIYIIEEQNDPSFIKELKKELETTKVDLKIKTDELTLFHTAYTVSKTNEYYLEKFISKL